MDDIQETYRKMRRLLSQLVVALVVFLPLLLFIWLPWPIALLLCIAVYVSAPILGAMLRQKWIEQRRATPVYQPPAPVLAPPEQPSYEQGYQARTPARHIQEDYQPQPKEASPGLVYEEPLVQYPD